MQIDDYAARFDEEPGYLNFAARGPIGRAVQEEIAGFAATLARARFGSFADFPQQSVRLAEAVAAITGLPAEGVVWQPSTSQGLMQVLFGLEGTVAASPEEFPSVGFAVQRAADARGRVTPRWIAPDHGRVTPGTLRDQLDGVDAVVVSLVDYRTGFVADLEGIRQVVGDRLLIVDANQGFGVVDAPYPVADVVAAAGAKWPRAGNGTAFLALGPRALERVEAVWSGWNASELPADEMPMGEVPGPASGARAFQISTPDPMAEARLAVALEEMAAVGVPAIHDAILERATRIIDLADEYALPVVSPRAVGERAGIVVVRPEPEHLNTLSAALHNHGVSATVRAGEVRLSPHATTDEETLAMLRAAFLSFATAVAP